MAVEAHVLFPAGLIGLVAAKLRRIPLVVYAHGTDVRVTARKNRLYARLARLVARSARVVATNSQDMADRIRTQFGVAAVVIEPGVDPGFAPSPRLRERRVLYLGGDRPHKGPEVARELADTFLGPPGMAVNPEELPDLIAAHDVVLVPSHDEAFGLVAAEAIASGRWVIARDIGGLREIVIDGVNGTLVKDGDFATALANVPNYDPFLVAQTAQRFSLITHRRRMERLYSGTVGDEEQLS